MKPKYIMFYMNDIASEDILEHFPFMFDTPRTVKRSREGAYFEYEHYTLQCIKTHTCTQGFRGLKAWQILVEDELYDSFSHEAIHEILMPMVCMSTLLGGRVVRVDKYNR